MVAAAAAAPAAATAAAAAAISDSGSVCECTRDEKRARRSWRNVCCLGVVRKTKQISNQNFFLFSDATNRFVNFLGSKMRLNGTWSCFPAVLISADLTEANLCTSEHVTH